MAEKEHHMPSTELAIIGLIIGGSCVFGGGRVWRPNSDRAGPFVSVFLGWLILLSTVYFWRMNGLTYLRTFTDGLVTLGAGGVLATVLSVVLFRWLEHDIKRRGRDKANVK